METLGRLLSFQAWQVPTTGSLNHADGIRVEGFGVQGSGFRDVRLRIQGLGFRGCKCRGLEWISISVRRAPAKCSVLDFGAKPPNPKT